MDDETPLPRRQSQTLKLLLQGKSEKEVASTLGLSPHTIHVYVKALYRHWGVGSRAELLSRVFGELLHDRSAEPHPASVDMHTHVEV